MKKKLLVFIIIFTSLFTIHYSLLPSPAGAVCPICTVAVGAGLGVSRALGVDDTVTSVWIGGLILSSSFWIIDLIKKKKPEFPILNFQFAIIFLMYLIVIFPLYWSKIIGLPFNQIMGVDKILFGTLVGSIVFLVGMWIDKMQRKKYGKQFFQYQKVVFPLTSLIITSAVLYLVTK